MKTRRLRLVAIITMLVVAAGVGAYFFFIRQNQAASCANCRRFAAGYLEDYAGKHDNWYPKGAGSPMHSLALTIADMSEEDKKFSVHCFTSHALEKQLRSYYEQHRTFHEDFCCYRYNEGLKVTDPGEMIVLYYFEPTRWECIEPRHRQSFLGRPVLTPSGMWNFIPEAEFQRRQAATRALIESRDKAQP